MYTYIWQNLQSTTSAMTYLAELSNSTKQAMTESSVWGQKDARIQTQIVEQWCRKNKAKVGQLSRDSVRTAFFLLIQEMKGWQAFKQTLTEMYRQVYKHLRNWSIIATAGNLYVNFLSYLVKLSLYPHSSAWDRYSDIKILSLLLIVNWHLRESLACTWA